MLHQRLTSTCYILLCTNDALACQLYESMFGRLALAGGLRKVSFNVSGNHQVTSGTNQRPRSAFPNSCGEMRSSNHNLEPRNESPREYRNGMPCPGSRYGLHPWDPAGWARQCRFCPSDWRSFPKTSCNAWHCLAFMARVDQLAGWPQVLVGASSLGVASPRCDQDLSILAPFGKVGS